jgi:hypothetical protein
MKTLSLKYVCQLLDITNVENCFAKNNTRRDIAQKKAGYPCGIAYLSTYPKMAFNEGITRLANSEKPQFT